VVERDHPGKLYGLKIRHGAHPRVYDRLRVIEVVSSTGPCVIKIQVNHLQKPVVAEVTDEDSIGQDVILKVEYIVDQVPPL
jgi:hypothetical protein